MHAAVLLALLAAPAVAAPHRVVSMNPCADAILQEVAAPGQVAGVSRYSQDPAAASAPVAWARRFPAVTEAAEAVAARGGDLVLAGGHVGAPTVKALGRLGVPVLKLGVPASVAESREQVLAVGRALGRVGAAVALAGRIEAATDGGGPGRGRWALIRQGGGLVAGPGTLADEMLRRAGWRNAAALYGLAAWDVVGLEPLLARPPAVVFTDLSRPDPARGAALLRRAGVRVAHFPMRLLSCGGPNIVPAMAALRAAG